MAKQRKNSWLPLAIGAVGLVVAAAVGLIVYLAATAPPLHPDPQEIQSVTQSALPQWTDAVEAGREVVRDGLTYQNLPGISVAVGIGGDIVWAEGFGWANVETRVPVVPDMRFRIGTASTALTSAAVGLLVEQGRLKLDDEIQKYVPAFPRKEWPVTLRQLMADVSGVANDAGDEGPLFDQRCERPIDALPFFAELPLLFKPDAYFERSSYAWILVSAAVEAAGGRPILAFMQEHIFKPLGMNDTVADSSTESTASANKATSYFPRFAANPDNGIDEMRPLDYSCYSGASAFLSTASDLMRFGMAISAGTLLQPATVELLQTPQRVTSGTETGSGLGWDLETLKLAGTPTRAVGRDGNILGGQAATFLILPKRGIVVSVLSNVSHAKTHVMALRIAERFAE
jgi:CubicO group peptidase (beta-lactamase class C family)